MEEASKLPPLQEAKRKGGRPKADVNVDEIQKWLSMGYSYADVAEKYLTSVSTIKRRLKQG
jgi:DNA invertase Pin-like site-specific DNA recombinase